MTTRIVFSVVDLDCNKDWSVTLEISKVFTVRIMFLLKKKHFLDNIKVIDSNGSYCSPLYRNKPLQFFKNLGTNLNFFFDASTRMIKIHLNLVFEPWQFAYFNRLFQKATPAL